ncbi:8-oxo-dGDP phosphatase NUDT18-like isoform X2 [Patiria miniata]|uniref:Nudix hydrolase domain-containing protein n=1 Tax=Patiria miniata TaxID=46514 RepID=A0A914BBP2_PATMI|nr:8-oxo-dGDP phosphatase NUDT18-like isoform X2 [Patiria miniata]
MSEIECCLGSLLAGSPPSVPVPKYDFFFKAPAKTHQRPLVLKDNLSIIVAAVIFDQEERVVLIQEAKASCRGRWYLPAGRIEPNETLQEAIQREVLEETGLEFQPSTVVWVESNHLFGYWMRFTFVGCITGGRLKTLEEADKESLQARWMSIEDIQGQVGIRLRAHDVMYLIQTALAYLQRDASQRHTPIMPVLNPHKHMCIRVILIKRLLASNGYFLRGLLCIEHLGRPHGSADGVCLNLLAVTDFQRDLKNPNYMWHNIANPEIKTALHNRTQQYRSLKCP